MNQHNLASGEALLDPLSDLSPLYARQVRHAVDILLEYSDPQAVFLFGSVARGEGHGRSDIDLLVRIPHASGARSGRGHGFQGMLGQSFPRVDIVIFNDVEIAHHLANRYSFLSSVMVSARPLWLANPDREPLLYLRQSVPKA